MNAFLVSKLGEDIARQIYEFDDVKQTQKMKMDKCWARFKLCPTCNKKPPGRGDLDRLPTLCGCYCVQCEEDRLDCVCKCPSFWADPWTAENIDTMM